MFICLLCPISTLSFCIFSFILKAPQGQKPCFSLYSIAPRLSLFNKTEVKIANKGKNVVGQVKLQKSKDKIWVNC